MSNNPFGSGYGAQRTSLNAPGAAAPQPTGAPPAAGDMIKDVSTASFSADVIAASRKQPVIVDFWAPWCGPCKQLTPILERQVKAAGGRVRLAKMNIDEHPSIPGQLGVQSIPAVFAFVDGRPVDGFMGAVPESEVKALIDRLAANGADVGDPVAEALEEAKRHLAEGDASSAAQVFAAVLQEEPDNVAAVGGLAECYLTLEDAVRARALVDRLPEAARADPALGAIRTKLKLAEEIAQLGDPTALERRIAADPDDHQARFDLALIAHARGRRSDAATHLLDIIRRDRSWNEDGARRKLLEFFEVWGPTDAVTKDARRGLSTLLFS